MFIIKALLRTAITLALLAWLLPTVDFLSWTTLILASIVLSLLFGVVRPILKLLFLPINIVTLGLFSGLITVFLLWLSTYLVPGFIIQPMAVFGLVLNQFWTLVVISFLIGFTQSLVKKIV
jgi:putative membrane protein